MRSCDRLSEVSSVSRGFEIRRSLILEARTD